MKDKVRPYGRENGHRWEYEEYEEDAWAAPRSGDGPSPRDRAVGTDSLDVNLVSNLLRWAYQAKRRLGPEGLMELLELYLRSGHHPRELRDVISFICSMVEEETTAYEADAAQDWVDLIHQLHGILAGGLPIATGLRTKLNGNGRGHQADGIHSRGI